MPNVGGAPKRRDPTIEDAEPPKKQKKAEPIPTRAPRPSKGSTKKQVTKASMRQISFDDEDDDGDEEDDEIIAASIKKQGTGVDKKFVAIGGSIAALVVIIVFLLVGGKKDQTPPPVDTPPPVSESVQEPSEEEDYNNPNIGIQDFTQNTTMNSDSPLTNPDGFLEDINGLTMRVEYTVNNIVYSTDFVNYTKCRGTWGGGLELYWLDCTYKDNKYVVQVPFSYYKELDDTGIVPVKMEVLYIKQPTGDVLTVISYMELDEATLQTFLKAQAKRK